MPLLPDGNTPAESGVKPTIAPPQVFESAVLPRLAWCSRVTAITGTMASGKSSVLQALKERGVFVISADDLAHEATAKGTPGLAAVVQAFGPGMLTAAGELDRRALAAVVFADRAKLKQLEAIVHPLVAQLAEERFTGAIRRGQSPLVYEVPLLFEAGLDKQGFQRIVVVTADDEVCVQRALARKPDIAEQDVRARLTAQWPAADKKLRADIVIDNSGTRDSLWEKVDALLEVLRG